MDHTNEGLSLRMVKFDDSRWTLTLRWYREGEYLELQDEVGPTRSLASALDQVASLVDDLRDAPFVPSWRSLPHATAG